MPKDTKTLGNSKARACESLGFVHKKGCARVLTHLHLYYHQFLLLLPEMLKNFHIPPNIYQTDNQRFRIKEAL